MSGGGRPSQRQAPPKCEPLAPQVAGAELAGGLVRSWSQHCLEGPDDTNIQRRERVRPPSTIADKAKAANYTNDVSHIDIASHPRPFESLNPARVPNVPTP